MTTALKRALAVFIVVLPGSAIAASMSTMDVFATYLMVFWPVVVAGIFVLLTIVQLIRRRPVGLLLGLAVAFVLPGVAYFRWLT